LQALKRDYAIIGKRRIKGWRAWLVIGVVIGVASGVVLVANRTGRLSHSEAAEISIDVGEAENKQYPYPPANILYHNKAYNSGWFYIAQTVPKNNKTFWVAAIRSASTKPQDTSAHLLYAITDIATGSYTQGIVPGTFTESATSTDLVFHYQGKPILRFYEIDPLYAGGKAMAHRFSLTSTFLPSHTLNFWEPFLYESGDGIVPMTKTLNSLYVSLAPLGNTFWADFQKFNIGQVSSSISPLSSMRGLSNGPNHRWGSVILNSTTGSLPGGTSIVYWDIFDANGNRQPGGFTNIDVLLPGGPQKSKLSFSVKELAYWQGSEKTYLKKWRLTQKGLGVDLIIETVIPNQEFKIPGVLNFYEGAVRVYDPVSGAQVGSGMWEQTHDESKDK